MIHSRYISKVFTACITAIHFLTVAQGSSLESIPSSGFSVINFSELADLRQSNSRVSASPAPATNFTGLLDNNTFSPPSIAAAAGTNRLVLALNTEITYLSKDGNASGTVPLSTFWASQIGGPLGRVLNPKLVYDDTQDRWIMTASGNPQTPASSLLLGISATSDPTQTWFLYSLDIDATNILWGDVGGLGFNDDWIVVSKNLRAMGGNAFNRSRVYVFDKTMLYGPNPVPNIASTNVLLDTIDDFTTPSIVPAVSRDSSPSVMYLMANGQGNDGSGNGTIRLFRMTSTTNLVFSLNQIAQPVGLAPWDDVPFTTSGNFFPQKDSASLIAAGDSRIQNVELRGGSLWCAQTVFLPAGAGTRSGAQWWELSTSGTVVQFGRVEDTTTGGRSFAYPSIAVNRNRSVLLGYSSFSPLEYPAAGYSFRFSNEPLGIMQTPVFYKTGEAPYSKVDFTTGLVRWGDYSATVIDPENDLDLWTVQEYASTPVAGVDRWGTHWAKVKLSTPPDGVFEVSVDPPSGSLIAAGVSQPFRVTVFDTFPVTNATVRVSVLGSTVTSKTLQNDGLAPDVAANDNVYSTTINTPPISTVLTNVFTISGVTNTTLVVTNFYTVAPPPLNDNFVNASKIPDQLAETNGVVVGGNFFASKEIGEPVHAGVPSFGNSVWWNWAPSLSGPVLLDTLGSRFNTVLAVYTNSVIDQLGVVASANDVTNQFGQFVRDKAFVIFDAVAGQTYRIAVAGASTNEFGEIRLRMAFNGTPDETKPLLAITNLTSTNIVTGTNSIINPPSGLIVNSTAVTLSGTAIDPSPNSSAIELVQIVGNDGTPIIATGTNEWTAALVLQPGSNLLQIVAFDTAKNRSIPVEFQITVRAFDPVNDIFANATPLVGNSGSVNFNNLNATFEGNEPHHAGKIGGHSVWFSFTPATDGLLSLTTTNSPPVNQIDTLLALYSGERINELVPISANDDAGPGLIHSVVSGGLAAGTKYSIAVDGLGGAKGSITLHYSFTPATNRLVTVETTSGGTVQPGSGFYQEGSLLTLLARTNSGFDFITWTGSVVSVENPITFSVAGSNQLVKAVFGRRGITDDFEKGLLGADVGWANQPGGNWSVQAASGVLTNSQFGGNYYLRTGSTSDSTTNEIRIVRELRAGEGGFNFKVTTEDNWDRFEFLVDDVVYLSRQGIGDWTSYRTNFPAGVHTLKWRYVKDLANAPQFDSVYIDNVDLPFLESIDFTKVQIVDPLLLSVTSGSEMTVAEATLNPRFSKHLTNEFKIRIEGQSNQIYVIQGSSDLANWVSFSTNHAPYGLIEYSDTNVITQPFRYYRAIIPFTTNASGRIVPTAF